MKYIILTVMVLAVSLLFISSSYGSQEYQMILREIDGVNRNIQELSAKNDTTNSKIDTLSRQITDMQTALVAADNKHEIEINNIKTSQKYGSALWGLLGGAGGTITIGGGSYAIVRRRNGNKGKQPIS